MQDKIQQITFIIHHEEHTVPYEAGDSLLDTAIKAGLNPSYSCMEGVCCACMAKCESGEVTMRDEICLSEDDIKCGRILTCQSKPKSDLVRINYDDI